MMPRMIVCSARALLLLCALLLAGCATPVGVTMVSPREAYQDAYANPLGAGVASDQAKYVLTQVTFEESSPYSSIRTARVQAPEVTE